MNPDEAMVEIPLQDLRDAFGVLAHYKSIAEDIGQTGPAQAVEVLMDRLKRYNNEAVQRNGGDQNYLL